MYQQTKNMYANLEDVQPAAKIVRIYPQEQMDLFVLANGLRMLTKHVLYAKRPEIYTCATPKLLKLWRMTSRNFSQRMLRLLQSVFDLPLAASPATMLTATLAVALLSHSPTRIQPVERWHKLYPQTCAIRVLLNQNTTTLPSLRSSSNERQTRAGNSFSSHART